MGEECHSGKSMTFEYFSVQLDTQPHDWNGLSRSLKLSSQVSAMRTLKERLGH